MAQSTLKFIRRWPSRAVTVLQHHLDAFKRWHKAHTDGPADAAAALLFAKFEPAIIQAYESVIKPAGQLSYKHLKEGGVRPRSCRRIHGDYRGAAGHKPLADTSQMIGQSAAAKLGLNVDCRTGSDPEWQIW